MTSDRLSPILVKELRQGIRSNLFTGAFLFIQTLLFFFGFSLVSSPQMRHDPSFGTGVFWVMLALPLLLLVPGTASQSVEREISGRTLELLLLTRLSAYRIVLGKWMSAVVQSALILSTVLPYMMLRYFLGGVDLWLELQLFLGIFLASAMLAGIAMGLWSVSISRWAKVGFVLLMLWLVPWMLAVFFVPHGGFGGAPGAGRIFWVYGVIIMLMMLDTAAARLAPPAENHSTRVRALALLALLVAFPLSRAHAELTAVMTLLVLVPTVVAALNESLKPVARLYEPFLRGSRLRQLAAFALCPGWPGGIAFLTSVALVLPWLPAFDLEMPFFFWLACVATFLVPAALQRTFLPPSLHKTGIYMILLVLSTVPVFLYLFAEGLSMDGLSTTLRAVGGLVPPLAAALEVQGFSSANGIYPMEAVVRPMLMLVTGLSLALLWRLALGERDRIRAMAESSETPAPAAGLALAR